MSVTGAARAVSARGTGTLTGTSTLVRMTLRRDRVRIAIWIAAIGLILLFSAASFPGVYGDAAERQARARLMDNPAAVAVGGPRIGLDDYTFGAMLTNEMMGFTAVAVALMSILLVTRHTRSEEEGGRTELVRASVVGRHAPLAAALSVAVLANLALAVVVAVGLGVSGIESLDWAGSWLFAAAVASVGLVFAAVAAVTAQITEHSRWAAGMAGLALGAAFALRAAGDVSKETLSWLSPIGWAQRTYAYVDDRWWPLLPAIVLAVALAATAIWLSARRDVGAGLRPARSGPFAASDRLIGPMGLALRMQRASLIGWAAGLLAFGLLYGTLLGEIESFAAELKAVEDLLAGFDASMIDAFLALILSLLAMVAAIYATLAVLRARSEETAGRAEPLLATPVSRTRWLASHAAVAAMGSMAILMIGALGLGVTGAVTLGDAGVLPTVLAGVLVYAAPLLLTVAVAVALIGLVPSAVGAAWIVVVYAIFAGMFGGLLGLPDWALDLSPFAAVPMLPADDFVAWPPLILVLLAAVLFASGIAGFRRRDLTTTA